MSQETEALAKAFGAEHEHQVFAPVNLLQQDGAAAMAHDREPLGHEGPVEARERHDVGHGRQRHEVEGIGELRFGTMAAEEALLPQGAVQRHQGQEDDAGGAEMAEARQVVEAIDRLLREREEDERDG